MKNSRSIGSYLTRYVVLVAGLAWMSFGIALTVRSDIGSQPWTVFHQGLASMSGMSIGRITQLVGLVVLAAGSLLLKQWPGFGTLLNLTIVGIFVDWYLAHLSETVIQPFPLKLLVLLIGVLISGTGGAIYISTNLGAGPRDGLMLGLQRLTGKSIRFIRTSMELIVLVIGFFLGGTVGLGTVICALGVGPVLQFSLQSIQRWKETAGPLVGIPRVQD